MRKKLIFFANSDPGVNPGNIRNAYHYALVGLKAGLETEVRLAADAVKIKEQGYPAIKIKLGRDGATDVERIRAGIFDAMRRAGRNRRTMRS